MTSYSFRRLLGIALCWLLIGMGRSVVAQESDSDEAKEKSIIDRFVVVLEKNPRRGTALDKVYGYHVERGSLERIVKSYRDKSQKLQGADAGSAWLIVGLLESLRGQDAAAVTALEQAEKLAPQNYLASYYLGQSLVLVGQPDKAAEALERSIQRKPAQADLLDIYQALGRVYQRAQKNDRAMDVWNRLEKQFPNDARVQEQIATTLLEENEYAEALPRYEALAKNAKDKYRQSQFQMESAGLKVRLGKPDEAIKEFETLLGQLLPENWLYRDVRRRIEAVYLRTDDQTGLIAYYENWIKKKPDDLDAVSRLARLLAGYGRSKEAQEWLQKGLKVAPKSKELRQALISHLVYEQKYADAAAQYEQLDKNDPNNPDTLREWGRLILKDTVRNESERKQAAANIWRRLTVAKPKDALVASQVGELFRHAEMTDEALELYRTAITLAPDQSQYHEYLGEYFHSLKRKDEALAEWRAIAAGKLRTPANVARLAEVLAGFGYLAEAVETNTEACQLDPKDFLLQVKQVDLLAQAEKHDDALVQLNVVRKLAANDEEREAWLSRELRELQATEKLPVRIVAARKALENASAEFASQSNEEKGADWFWLARACEADRQLKEAVLAVTKASELAPQSVPILLASARIHESQNSLLAAVDIYNKLAAIDRRYRTEYLKQVATLEQKLGRRDKAMQAGRDLIAAAPGNPEVYEFFSHLCFQLGETEEGLGALRRSVRVNPTEPKGLLLLASALGEQFRTGEAIELYWRAFEKAASLEDRLGVVPKLTELYLQTNQFDRILERLERQRREPNQLREMTICLAQAYQTAGDDGNARQELEKLLTEDTRDTQLLVQLVKLCESDGDMEAAVKFQQQFLKASPGKEATMRLAQLLAKSGEMEEAWAIISRLTAEEKDIETALKSLDSMLSQGNFESALQSAEKLAREQPNQWELLYREGFALGKTKEKAAEARAVFDAILALKVPDDDACATEKNKAKKGQGINRSSMVASRTTTPMTQRSYAIHNIRVATGLEEVPYYQGQQPFWTPKDFGEARMACFAWLVKLARDAGSEAEFMNARRESGEKAEARREVTDWCYLAAISGNSRDLYLVLKKLSLRPDADADVKLLYLNALPNRKLGAGEEGVAIDDGSEDVDTNQSQRSKLAVLDKDEIDHVLACYRTIDEQTLMKMGANNYLQIFTDELKRSGRKDEAAVLLKETLAAAKSQVEIASLLPTIVDRNDFDTAMILLNRMAELKTDSTAKTGTGAMNAQRAVTPESQVQSLARLMEKRAQKKKIEDVQTVWDWYSSTVAARREQLKKATANKRNPQAAQTGQRGYVMIWHGNSQNWENLDFPSANEIYDQPSITLLRQIYTIYKEAETSNILVEHFRQKLSDAKASADEKSFVKFGLGYLHWWQDEKDDALSLLTEATDELQDGTEMRFELARVHEKRGEHQQALEIIDALPVADQQAMQKREITALRMAVNSGNIDRARLAAERLFGLRLDSNLQIQLAQQMHQLGMHEQAEAVLARAGRQAGNKTDVLSNLMQQYQSQGKNDVATQIAYQLLRRSGVKNSGTRMNSYQGDNNGPRQHAFTVLKRSGKLPEMIKKIEGQLKNSPKSQKLLETLIEYYMANGDDKKAAELASSLAESKQDDPQFRYNLGKQLMDQGKHSESVSHFKIAFKKDARFLGNDFWQIMNSFQNANKIDELASIFDEVDLKGFRQQPWQLTNIISNLSYNEKSKDQSIKLLKRAWNEMPDQRSQLLQSLNNDIFWQMPEIYDYAKQGIIPAGDSAISNNNWPGFGQIQNWGNQDGKIVTLLTRFLTLAGQKHKLDELTQEIEAAQKKLPQWEASQALLALIDLRRGKTDAAKETFEKMLPTFKSNQRGQYTVWEIGQELMAQEKCVDLAVLYLEAASKDPNVMQMAQMNGFQYSPGKSLIEVYKRRGRKEDARKLLLSSTSTKGSRGQGNEAWEAYQRIQGCTSLANEIKELGFPVDAIRLYQEQLARSEDFVVAVGVFGGGTNGSTQMEQMKNQLQFGMQTAMKELRPELLPQLLIDRKTKSGEQDSTGSVDLFLLLESRELDKIQLTSVFGNLVAGVATNPRLIEQTRASMAEILEKNSTDVSLRILDALLTQSLNDTEKSTAAVNRLVELIDQTPLEPQPPKGGFTAKQREAAKLQVGLWLAARGCLKQMPLRDQGVKLAERALEASRRLADNGYSLAILREWGQIALDSGDKDAAKQRWIEMLEMIVPNPVDRSKLKAANDGKNEPGTAAAVVEAPGKTTAPLGQKGPVVTLAQFEQAAQFAKLAAENGYDDLSLDAMTRVLQSGPPVEAILAIDLNQNFSPRNNQQNQPSPVAGKIQEKLTSLDQLWRQKGVSEESIYNILERAVLSDARPFEVFLHPLPMTGNNQRGQQNPTLQTPQNVGALLAASTVKANKEPRLKQLIETRLKQPLGEVTGRILLAQLALAMKDFPTANEQIELLTNRLKQDSSQTANELASQIAIPALDASEVRAAGLGLLEQVIDHVTQNQQSGRGNGEAEPMRTFRFSIARSYYRQNNPEAAKRHLEDYLKSLIHLYQNYGGDYPLYLRRLEFMNVAEEYARAGQQVDLLDCLGRYADLPASQNYGQAGNYTSRMMSTLTKIPQAERFQVLKSWSMPTAERKSVRVVAGPLVGDLVPTRFDAQRGDVPKHPRETRLTSTADLLIQSAKESNRLDELKQELLPFAEQNVEQSKFLLQMTKIAQGKGAEVLPALQELIDERKHPKEATANQQQLRNTVDQSDAVLALAAIHDDTLREKGRELLAQFIARGLYGNQQSNMLAILRREYYAPVLDAETVDRLDHEPWNAGLKHWTASGHSAAQTESNGFVPMWWLANEGLLCHLFGSESSQMFFNYPLTGEFEVTFDAWSRQWMDNSLGLGYGGTIFSPNDVIHAQNYGYQRNGNNPALKQMARIRHDSFNRIRLKVGPQKAQYFVNGDLVRETSKRGDTSPWLYTYCNGISFSAIRNLRIWGQPEIPREVRLISPDSLAGWLSDFYAEMQPPAPPEPDEVDEQNNAPQSLVKEFDWQSKDGVIQGRRSPMASLGKPHVVQSRLYYNRPFIDGDRVRYEFWYETGANSVHVHPALDRLAFLLDADGLKLHWMTANNSTEETNNGLTSSNVLVDESIRRGPIKLVEKDWNAVEISLKNSVVTISLNGTVIGEYPLERENGRQFGFYHDKNMTSVQVRNVVLQGDWPEKFSTETRENLFAPSHPLTRAERRGFARAIDEKFHAASVDDLLAETRFLSPDGRFQALKNWVLPNDDHAALRLYGTFTSPNTLPEKLQSAPVSGDSEEGTRLGRRQYSSSELAAPALDLVTIAQITGRLDELKKTTEPEPGDDAALKRSKLAFRTIVQIANHEFAEATEGFHQLLELCKTNADDAPSLERWPELVAGYAGLQHAELREATLPLLTLLVDQSHVNIKNLPGVVVVQNQTPPFDPDWEARTVGMRDRCKSLMETDHFPFVGGSSPKKQWISSRIERTAAHLWGPASRWQFHDGTAFHLGGEGDGYLYYQSPLRGTFTVNAEVSTARRTETRLMYHGRWVGPEYSKTLIEIGSLSSHVQGAKIEPALEFDEWCRLKLDIAPNKATYFINDRQVHEDLLPNQPDPWLALMTSGNHSGRARKVQITGNPEIPAEIDLSAGDELIGWTANLYSDPTGVNRYGQVSSDHSNDAWKKSNDEIVGQKFDVVRNLKRQSLLRYHKPIAEDAELSFEFFYIKGQTHVHPALGRMAYLLDAEGVKLHWLTDADSDRYGLSSDNETVESDDRRGPATLPLKENDWNRLQLKIDGDELQLKLNDESIYCARIPLSNQRQFGLFHYANETDVRVRNVIYRGEWPKTLPELNQQEMSGTSP